MGETPHSTGSHAPSNRVEAPSMMRVAPLLLPFKTSLSMPGSKSLANRAIIAACLSPGETVIEHATLCDDVRLMVENVRKMGCLVQEEEGPTERLRVSGGIPQTPTQAELWCGNAGTTVRFLTSLACVVPGEWVITGDERMQKRPIGQLVQALRSLGADIESPNGCPPLSIRGGVIRGGAVTLDASTSSQFLSSLLLIAPALPEGLSVTLSGPLASPSYVSLTLAVMHAFGIAVTNVGESRFTVSPQPYSSPKHYAVEGDWSAAGAFLVLSALMRGSIDYTNVDPHSTQGDRAVVDALKLLSTPGDFHVDCTDVPDQVMNLAVFASFRKGTTIISGAKNLRVKECDRLAVLSKELAKAGVAITERDDGVEISGGAPLNTNPVLDPNDDHRMAMAFAILGMLGKGVTIAHPSCVSKSYPSFFRDLATVRASARTVVIIGMRGAGKSHLARRLASALHLSAVDSDSEIEREVGMKISQYIQKNGWPAFRAIEEQIIDRCLTRGTVIAVGGGAIESAVTRERMKNCLVIWMQMSERGAINRLKLTKRPPLTDLPLDQEVRQVLARRDPLYSACADIVLPERVPFKHHVSCILDALRSRLPLSST